jgi:hypothetical protein
MCRSGCIGFHHLHQFFGLTGFEIYPSIPAARQRSRSPFMAWAVIARMGMPPVAAQAADRGSGLKTVHIRHRTSIRMTSKASFHRFHGQPPVRHNGYRMAALREDAQVF